MRVAVVAIALSLIGSAAEVSAEWHVKPFLGIAFGGDTTFIDVEDAAGSPTIVLGVSGVLLGEVVGLDIDFSHAPGLFESGDRQLLSTAERLRDDGRGGFNRSNVKHRTPTGTVHRNVLSRWVASGTLLGD